MDHQTFSAGYDPETYVRNLRNYRSFVRSLFDEGDADDDHAATLKVLARGYVVPVRATVMAEDWCGDAVLNAPILASLFRKAAIEVRFFRGSEHDDLKRFYEADGTDHTPVLSLWDANWKELGRWIEAPKAIEPLKSAWKSERPQFMELYSRKATDKDAERQFARLYREFLEEMATWYRESLWDETTREVVDLLRAPAGVGLDA
jgi:hypothetical protein